MKIPRHKYITCWRGFSRRILLKRLQAFGRWNEALGLLVYNNANAQMDSWNIPVCIIRIDMEQHSDLTQQYDVIRAPTLVLLNARSEIVWRQDETLNDVAKD